MAATTMYDSLYGKYKPKRRRKEVREKNMNEEKKKENEEKEPRGYMSQFNGKEVEIKLSTGDVFSGNFATTAYNKFDVLLTNTKGCFLIPKHAIAYIIQKEEQKKE